MFKKFSYLASVSVLATMVMSQAMQAMDDDQLPTNTNTLIKPAENNLWKSSTVSDIHNLLYYDPKGDFGRVDPRRGMFSHIFEAAKKDYLENITGKIDTFFKLQRQIRSGKYDELTGEAIEILIASLAGKTQQSLFGKSNKELDAEVLVKASNKLVNMFLQHLSINHDIYGEDSDGRRVTIFNRSLFKMFAQQCFPDVPIVKGIAIKLLDNEHLKNFIQTKLIETIVGRLKKSLEQQGITLKGKLGDEVTKFTHSMIYDESSINFKKLYEEYLSPHLNHHLRYFILPLAKKAKDTLIQKVESDVWYATVPVTGSLFSYAGYTTGSLIYSCTDNPILKAGGFLLGAAGTLTGGIGANSCFNATRNYISQYIDDQLFRWAHHLTPYSKEEHALYGLNDRPTDIEKGLAPEDYALREALNSQTYLGNALKSMAEASGIRTILNAIFGKNVPTKPLITYCMCEEQEQAYRQLALLKEQNSAEAEKIAHNLRKYPSYEQKLKFLRHLDTTPLNEIELEEDEAQKYAHSRKEVVKKIRGVAALLIQELCRQYEQFSSSKDPFFAAFAEELLLSSIESQDHIIEWVKNHPGELRKFVEQFAKQNKYEDFFEISSSNDKDDSQGASSKILNKAKVKAFVATLMQTCVKKYIDQVNTTYVRENKGAITYLLSKPLTEGMDHMQVAYRLDPLLALEAESHTLFKELLPEITPMILHLLDDQELLSLSMISHTWHKLCLDIIDERKAESNFKLKELDPEDANYFAKYRHDILVIDSAYRELQLNHLAYTLYEILNNHLQQKNVLKRVKFQIIKEHLGQGDDVTPTLEDLIKQVAKHLNEDQEYNNVNNLIREEQANNPALQTLYRALRSRLVADEAQNILKELNEYKDGKVFLDVAPPPESKKWFSWGGQHADLTQDTFDADLLLAQKNLDAHDNSPKGVRGVNLMKVIKAMEFENNSTLSLKDFINIHNNILKSKLTKANEADRSYVAQYGSEEIYIYKSSSPLFRDKLFYGYAELIKEIRAQNRQLLKTLFLTRKK